MAISACLSISSIVSLAAEQRDADAGGAVVFVAVKLVRLPDSRENFIADRFGLCRSFWFVSLKVFQHHHEFVTAQPGNGVAFADAGFKTLATCSAAGRRCHGPECR